MPTKLITKNSSTASAVPTAGQLDQGELAVNVTDKRLFTKDSGGTVRELGTNPTSITTGTIDATTITADGLTVDGATDQVIVNGTSSTGATSVLLKDSGVNSLGAVFYNSAHATLSNQAWLKNYNAAGSIILASGGGSTKGVLLAANNDISFYEDTGTTAKLFWDASAESLNIGHTYTAYTPQVSVLGKTATGVTNSTENYGYVVFAEAAGTAGSPNTVKGLTCRLLNNSESYGASIDFVTKFGSVRDAEIVFKRSNGTTTEVESARIDSSGNLLVGKTSTDFGVVGTIVETGGNLGVTRTSAAALNVNRLTTDGDIAKFYKDGTTVGSIGSASGAQIYIGTGNNNLIFNNSSSRIYPVTSGAAAVRDAAIDLGDPSARFKDLYLSGGVYLGGTGAANHLDDYETGTFTPTVRGSSSAGTASYTSQFGQYTKVGDMVYFHLYVNYNSLTGTGQLQADGLPFTSKTGFARIATVGMANIAYSGDFVYAFTVAGSTRYGLAAVNNGAVPVTLAVDTAGIIEITGSYHI